MHKTAKNILIVFIIGVIVFIIGNLLSGGFSYKTLNEFLEDFIFYQLYSFVLGYSNMAYFNYLETLNWKPTQRIKRFFVGIIGASVITLIGLFLLRSLSNVFYYGNSFDKFIAHESFENYTFGLWITLTIVVAFHVFYYYNEYQQKTHRFLPYIY